MWQYYLRWLAACGLLTCLAACSTDASSEKQAARAAQPAALPLPATRPSAHASGSHTAGEASETPRATSPRSLVWAPASPELGPNLLRQQRASQRRLARPTRRWPARRPVNMDAPGTAPAGPPTDTLRVAKPAPNTASAANTSAAVAAAEPAEAPTSGPKQADVFHIRPDRDTVLYGTEGTVLRVPAGTFVQAKGVAPTGLIELRLREFYSMADILLERLSTMAGPRLLETGGMIHLTATASGQECKLRPGSNLELGFPATRPIDGMQLYDGRATRSHDLTWKLAPQAPKEKKAKAKASHWRQPHFDGGYRTGRQEIKQEITYSPATVRRLNGYQPPHRLRRQLRRAGKRVPIVGTVEASFEVSEKGGVGDVFLRNAGQADSVLEAAVLQALRKIVVGPSRRGKEATRSIMKVDVRFTADRRVLVDHLRWDRPATLALYQADAERKAMGTRPLTDAQLQAAPLDVVTDALFKKRRNNAKRYSVKNFLGEQLNYVKELAVFRVVALATPRPVGWYNCDRPVPPAVMLATMFRSSKGAVKAPTGGAAKLALVHLGLDHPATQPADISLVLRERRCVIRGDASAGRIEFEQLANGTAATLVAIRREQGQLYLALRDVTVSQHVEPALEFRPVTVAELKTAVARLDL